MPRRCRNIHEACKAGDTKEVERFIRKGVDIFTLNDKGLSPIDVAAVAGHRDRNTVTQRHRDTVKLLMDHGAHIDMNLYGSLFDQSKDVIKESEEKINTRCTRCICCIIL